MSESEFDDVEDATFCLEDPAMYRLGGYHPVAIGDVLHHGRYRVLHRLGHGVNFTVWLALDQRYESTPAAVAQAEAGTETEAETEMETETETDAPRSRYVAVRISTDLVRADPREGHPLFSFLPPWRGAQPSNCDFVVAVLDEFETVGPNGIHRCLVTEFLGPSVAAVQFCRAISANQLLPLPTARRTALQLAEAVTTLQDRKSVV